MPAATQTNNVLSLALDTEQVNCQIIDLKFKLPSTSAGRLVRTACPDGLVAEPGEPVPGTITGTAYTDTTADGLTTILLDALAADGQLGYNLTLWSDLGNTIAFNWAGQLKVAELELAWEKPGIAKHPLSLTVLTATRTRPGA